MPDQSPLIVPMTVEAFVVNDPVRTGGNTFLRVQMEYNAMQRALSGQPGLANNDRNFTSRGVVPPFDVPASDYYNGVYLKWRLPRAFTRGAQDSVDEKTIWPRVPNRWLVVRNSGVTLGARIATAWMIESDYPWPIGQQPQPHNASQLGAKYVGQEPTGGVGMPVGQYIGRNTLLGSWTESGVSLGLTAMAPGNPAFSLYQPQCNNVFSFIDILNGQPPQILSYLVLGWFSDGRDDILHTATQATFANLLASLGWTLPPDTDPSWFANWSLSCGSVSGVEWQTMTLPPGGVPSGTPVSIAAGNTAVEALTALVTAQAGGANVEPELLEAFQLDLVDVLDEPDGAAVLAEKLQASFFQRYGGGYTWTIVDAPDANTPITAAELAKEQAWLAALAAAQDRLDEDLRELVALRVQLYAMWWKYMSWNEAWQGSTSIPNLTKANIQTQLDPETSGTIAWKVTQQLAAVDADRALVPSGDTPQALEAAIAKYAADHQLPATRLLKRGTAPPFYQPNNPVVLIAGAGASGIVQPPATIECRFPSQAVTGFTYNGTAITAQTPNLVIPRPDLTGVRGVPWTDSLATSLVSEFFFLDPGNAAAVAAAIQSNDVPAIAAAMRTPANDIGVWPTSVAVQAWTANPWHPLQLLWMATWYPIGYGTTSSPNWQFYEGQYTWNTAPAGAAGALGLQGLIQLTPAAAFNMEARLRAFLANNPHLDPAEKAAFENLLTFVRTHDAWDLLSQGLDGFNEQLRLGTPGVFLDPETTPYITNPPLSTLLGDVKAYPPSIGDIPVKGQQPPPSLFQPWRAGQFGFLQLLVVDEWGQALWPINALNSRYETIFTPDDLSPVLTSRGASLTIASGPAIDAISPALVAAGSAAFELTVDGVAFDAAAVVHWNGAPLATTFVSATRVTATVPAALVEHAGTIDVTVADRGVTSPAIPLSIASGAAIGSLRPSLIQAGMAPSALVELTIEGVSFAPGTSARWGGAPLETTYVSATRLVASVPANFLAAPAEVDVTVITGQSASAAARFIVSAGAAITKLTPDLVSAGGATFTLTVEGVGFSPGSVVRAATQPTPTLFATTFVDETRLTAIVPASLVAAARTLTIVEAVGARVPQVGGSPQSLVQLPPAVLQPARLDFDFVSALDDSIPFGPVHPDANPVCGWVLPNHLDASLMAYDAAGAALGEMAIGMPVSGPATICWTNAPDSGYSSLQEIAEDIPHFGPFLLTLSGQTPQTFTDVLRAIDETLWSTVPMDAVFDKGLAVLMGRPLAMVRARVAFELDGRAYEDPSWQYTFAPAPPPVTGYELAIELGNLARLNDGLIGYFVADTYTAFNVVRDAGTWKGGYLRTIGVDGNYLYLPPARGSETFVSMLVDPRAGVHATTAILPTSSLALPPQFVNAALDVMDITFRVNGIVTDQRIARVDDNVSITTLLMPTPQEKTGKWSWLQNAEGRLEEFAIGETDATARLSNVAPVLRRGLLKLTKQR
jgi:hypothetical protein